MTAYCKHDLPAGQCADCVLRAAAPCSGTWLLITEPGNPADMYHRHGCPATYPREGTQPWPRREVTAAEIAANPGVGPLPQVRAVTANGTADAGDRVGRVRAAVPEEADRRRAAARAGTGTRTRAWSGSWP